MSKARFGIDVLLENLWPVAGRRIGLITNSSGVTPPACRPGRRCARRPTCASSVSSGPSTASRAGPSTWRPWRRRFTSPRAFRSSRSTAPRAEDLKPRREDFADLEAIVFDVQDVGSRYYTYIWTMLLAMEACAGSRLRFVVCDRPNPIGGAVEGAPQATGYLTFVGLHPIPVRHGMTAGELARLFVSERRMDLDLVVCPVAGWTREMALPTPGCRGSRRRPTCRPWTRRSSTRACACSKARTSPRAAGTTRPFEVFGAPWLDGPAFADALNALALPGVQFLPHALPADVRQARRDRLRRRAAPRHRPRDVPAFPDGTAGHRGRAAPRRRSTFTGAPSPTSTTRGRRSTCSRAPTASATSSSAGETCAPRSRGTSTRRSLSWRGGSRACSTRTASPPPSRSSEATTPARRASSSRSFRGSRRGA